MDEFPALAGPSHESNRETTLQMTYKKYLVIKHQDPQQKITDINPIEIDNGLTRRLGKPHRCKVTRLRSGLLLVEVDRKQLYDKLMQTSKLNGIPIKVEEHSTLNTSKGVIFCDSVRDMNDSQLLDYLEPQGVKEVYRIRKRKGDRSDPTDLFIITFNKPILPTNIKIGYLNIKVNMYIPNPRQCFKCQGYGHGKNVCRNEMVCAKCGTAGHEWNDCNNDQHCCHCRKDHPSSSRQCPMWQLEKKITDLKFKQNITYKEARDRTYSQHPELVAEIPKLKNSQKQDQPSYRNVHATSMTPGMQQFCHQQQQQIANLTKQIDTLVALYVNK